MSDMICEKHGETDSLMVSKCVRDLVLSASEPIPRSLLVHLDFPIAKDWWNGFWALKEELPDIGVIVPEDASEEEVEKNVRLVSWMQPYCSMCFAEVFGDSSLPIVKKS